MAYVQQVYHFVGRDSIDVRTLEEDVITIIAHNYKNTITIIDYISDKHKQDHEVEGQMLREHFPEMLI